MSKPFKNDKKSNLSKKADFTERDKGISPALNKKKGRITGESVLKIWRNFSYLLVTSAKLSFILNCFLGFVEGC